MAERAASEPDGSSEPGGGYTATAVLLGQVIALQGVRIARERSRPRPDRTVINELERARAAAVTACRGLTSTDPDGVERTHREYAPVFLTLLTAT